VESTSIAVSRDIPPFEEHMATRGRGIWVCLVAGALGLAACGDSLEPNEADGALRSTLATVVERINFPAFPILVGDGLTEMAIQ